MGSDPVMEKETAVQMSERFRVGALLAMAGGLLDAYTYVMRGGVFANAQTGNIVLLGVRAIEGEWGGVLHYLLPILAFAVGVIAAELIKGKFRYAQPVHWRQISLGIELAVLLCVTFLPQSLDALANVAVSFVCAVQVESFRKVHGNAFATTMCTGNLRSGTEQLYQFLRTGQRDHLRRAVQYGGIILSFIVGAALGAWCSGLLGLRTAAVACIPLFIALCLMRANKTAL